MTTKQKYRKYRQTPDEIREMLEELPRNETGCWEWPKAKRQGYGVIGWLGKTYVVHRLAYQLFVRDPGRLQVNHHCDNRACCNPDHLYIGTQRDNINDMHRRDRGRAKLTNAQVLAIRERLGENQTQLGREFGVSQNTISRVQRGEGWSTASGRELCRGQRAKLTAQDVRLIRELLPGHTGKDLARMFGVQSSTIYAIRDGRAWKGVV